jgi:hypothetical protein
MPFGDNRMTIVHGLGLLGLLCYAPPTILAIAHLLGVLQ